MELTSELRRLRGEHAELHDLAEMIRSQLGDVHPENLRKLVSFWQGFQTLMVRHLKCEDWILYPRVNASPNEQLSHLADQVFAQYGDLADRVLSHGDQWAAPQIEADWAGFCAETTALLLHAEQRAYAEENFFFPAIASDYAMHRRSR